MDLKLYVIPGSHPCATVEAALDLKGLPYERVDLLPGLSALLQLARFGRRTVPGLSVDGYKVSGSRLILRTLDGLKAEPRLYSGDPAVERPSAGATTSSRARRAGRSCTRSRRIRPPATPSWRARTFRRCLRRSPTRRRAGCSRRSFACWRAALTRPSRPCATCRGCSITSTS